MVYIIQQISKIYEFHPWLGAKPRLRRELSYSRLVRGGLTATALEGAFDVSQGCLQPRISSANKIRRRTEEEYHAHIEQCMLEAG